MRRHRCLDEWRDEAAGEVDGLAAVVGKRLAGMPSEMDACSKIRPRCPVRASRESIVARLATGSKL
jgi:hypothetical protein